MGITGKSKCPAHHPTPSIKKDIVGGTGSDPGVIHFFFQEYYKLSSLKVIQVIRQVSQSNLKSNGFHLLTHTGITICKYLKKNIQVCVYFSQYFKKSLIWFRVEIGVFHFIKRNGGQFFLSRFGDQLIVCHLKHPISLFSFYSHKKTRPWHFTTLSNS